jgi:hypothetical protein
MAEMLRTRQDTLYPALLDKEAIDRLERYRELLIRASDTLRYYDVRGTKARALRDEIREAIR